MGAEQEVKVLSGPRWREPDTEETRALAWSEKEGGPARERLVEV